MHLKIDPFIKASRYLRNFSIVYLVFFASGDFSRPKPFEKFNRNFKYFLKEEAYFGRPVGALEAKKIYKRELTAYLNSIDK